ncbi:MAG: hypothetical protein IKM20_06005 [Erysipelotrichales bacterium]|nr:hypothetical protein [Erysipelotrichales bacterium]
MKMDIFLFILFFAGTIINIDKLLTHTFAFTTFNIFFAIVDVILMCYHLKAVIDKLRDRKKSAKN